MVTFIFIQMVPATVPNPLEEVYQVSVKRVEQRGHFIQLMIDYVTLSLLMYQDILLEPDLRF